MRTAMLAFASSTRVGEKATATLSSLPKLWTIKRRFELNGSLRLKANLKRPGRVSHVNDPVFCYGRDETAWMKMKPRNEVGAVKHTAPDYLIEYYNVPVAMPVESARVAHVLARDSPITIVFTC